jgi:hypothetical protein
LLSNLPETYLRSIRDEPSLGILRGLRPEPTLDEARVELSDAISRIATPILKDKYGPLVGVVSQPAVKEFLQGLESNLLRARGDLSLILEELIDRIIPKN